MLLGDCLRKSIPCPYLIYQKKKRCALPVRKFFRGVEDTHFVDGANGNKLEVVRTIRF